jgi:hypothetical protein
MPGQQYDQSRLDGWVHVPGRTGDERFAPKREARLMHLSEPEIPVNATAHDADYEAPVLNVLGEFHALTQRAIPKPGGNPDGFGFAAITNTSR